MKGQSSEPDGSPDRQGAACHQPAGVLGVDRMSDSLLLTRFIIDRDEAAFMALVRRYGSRVRGVCRRLLRDHDAAEDACQETFLILFRKAHLISKRELLAGWLYGVALRIARHAKTAAARRTVREKRAAADKVADPFVDVTNRELSTIVAAEVKGLPEKYRASVILFYWHGQTSEEIARQLGCPTGSVSWRLGRGRAMLRHRLSKVK
jgi:RNA polymerase sigma factor (sigma-70 family)